LFPSERLPKVNAADVIIEDKEVAFLNTCNLQGLETPINQLTTKTLSTPVRMNGQVVDISTPAVMTSQNSTDEQALGSGEETHAGIPFQIGLDIFPGVGAAQPNSFALLP
jgi:hypothetical protein